MRREFFEKAYRCALKNKSDTTYKYWLLYTEGTLAYFNRDTEHLRFVISQINEDDNNKSVLKRLLSNLQNGGNPETDYLKTYFAT